MDESRPSVKYTILVIALVNMSSSTITHTYKWLSNIPMNIVNNSQINTKEHSDEYCELKQIIRHKYSLMMK